MAENKALKILQASAGSGKTFSLAAHYLTLLFASETKYREILAVTFTNKATAEMKVRILQVLKGLALGTENSNVFRDIVLAAHPHLDKDSICTQAHRIYRRILHDYSRFAVNTIDGFVQKVIRSFSFELGLDAGYKLEMNTAKVKRELAAKLNQQLDRKPELLQWIINLALERIRDNKSWNYHETLLGLSEEIFKERYQPFENALKSLDQTSLFKDLQQATKEIISFFEDSISKQAKAASDIFRDSGVLLDELKGKSRSPLGNLVKIADGDYAKVVGLHKLVDAPDEWQKGNLTTNVSQLYEQLNDVLDKLFKFYVANLPQYQMAKAIDANLYYLRLMQEMASLLGEYREENSTLLISDAQNLLRGITGEQEGNPSFIWEKMGSRYRHFLFDEFQDTSSFQWLNFLPLLKNAIAEANGKLIDHLIVGDVKQSIYRWRNGDWRILHSHAKKHIGAELVHDDNLLENYRSTTNIIDFNNFLFRHSPGFLQQHINNKVLEEGGQELFSEWWQAEGYDQIISNAYAQSGQEKAPSTLKGGTVQVSFLPVTDNRTRASESREEALERMASTLHEWICSGRYTAGQVCVLVRSNREAREVIEYLLQHQQECSRAQAGYKPYEVLSGEALLIANNSAVRLLINTLQAMVGKHDEVGIYKAASVQLYNQQHNKAVAPGLWLKLNTADVQNLSAYLPESLCQNWLVWQQLPLPQLIEQIIAAYQLDKISLHIPYLLAFRDLVSSFSKLGERGISTFLHWWQEEGEGKALPSSEQSNAVQVITIHKSKGLAFDVVMMPFCSWNLDGMANSIFWVETAGTPYSMLNSVPVHYKKSLGQSAFAKAYFEELLFNYMDALNMLYVAVTRTRKHLYITAPASAKDEQFSLAGDMILKSLAMYASEIGAEFTDGGLLIDEPVEAKSKSAAAIDDRFTEKNWSFGSYPISNRLNDALTDHKVFEQLDLLSGNSQQKRGVILHELLARAAGIAELPDVLRQMQEEGWFRKADETEIMELAQSVFLQPELKAILDKPYQRFNEQTIISSKGESYRPDKVLVGDDQVLIIDFKFTGEPKPQHYKQVEEYRDLLTEMGYQNISAYLYYGYLKELKAV
ncbi:MAG: helicase UvrD [Sphingobacteriaceae bacterium]|jgi:ATP-dependent exoDNAse (exonuclease V) beta subunit|nr:helicase UvrD [Sphingobacteriaceae bacterium]